MEAKRISATQAVELMKAGLQSGSIKLNGAHHASNPEGAQREALNDAAYLRQLFEELADDPVDVPAMKF